VILLLHGFPDDGRVWNEQVEFLSEKNYRIIVPDVRGCGQSSKPKDVGAYSVKESCKDVLGLLAHLSIDKFYLIGHDLGAALAWRVASTIPQRVIKLAALSTGHPGAFLAAGIKQKQLSWYMLLFQMEGVESAFAANDYALWRLMLREEPPGIVEQQIAQFKEGGQVALTAGLNWYRANTPVDWIASTTDPEYPLLPMQVLGLWSTRDAMLTEEQMTGSARFVERGKFLYQRIEAGHWMQIEQPAAVNKALLKFLQAPSARSSL